MSAGFDPKSGEEPKSGLGASVPAPKVSFGASVVVVLGAGVFPNRLVVVELPKIEVGAVAVAAEAAVAVGAPFSFFEVSKSDGELLEGVIPKVGVFVAVAGAAELVGGAGVVDETPNPNFTGAAGAKLDKFETSSFLAATTAVEDALGVAQTTHLSP